jgi:hypothetical protein
MMALERDLGP